MKPSKAAVIGGWVMGGLPAAMLLFSAVMKFSGSAELTEGMTHLGYDPKVAVGLGVTELVATVLYLVPQTAVLGAVLLTGYMGGAMASHLRIGEPFILQFLFGVLLWGGLWLRDPRLRALMPLRRREPAPAADNA